MFPECIPVATLDRVIGPKIGVQMPREFTSQKALRNHAELTGYVHLWEGTRAFTTRQQLLSADQYEIVDVRTDRGMTICPAKPIDVSGPAISLAPPVARSLPDRIC
jgi:hypothetical protein